MKEARTRVIKHGEATNTQHVAVHLVVDIVTAVGLRRGCRGRFRRQCVVATSVRDDFAS
eukprot:SAG11_NODE_2639_length_3140_cov_3.871095_1_plen_59_part_00